MLRVAGVSKAFGAVRVLHEVELDAAAGVITGIIGPNGAGKSTLLYVIGGLLKPDTGRIVLEGADITAVVPYKRALRGLVRTFQLSRELGELTVLENLLFARPNQTGESVWKAFAFPHRVRCEERAAADHARTILERVGLWRLADQPARGLSGGQKKLLELCRALMLAISCWCGRIGGMKSSARNGFRFSRHRRDAATISIRFCALPCRLNYRR